jgi:hypothetical protein
VSRGDRESLSHCGLGKSIVECHEWEPRGLVVACQQRCGKLQRVRRAERVCSKKSARTGRNGEDI